MKIGSKLKALRKARKMTLQELSEKSGVQIATLSRIEHNIMTGTLQSHISICKALGIPLSEFYREIESDEKSISIGKRSEKRESFVHPKKSTIEMLTTKIAQKKMMPVLIRIKKGGQTHKEENKLGTEKFLYILDGKLQAQIGKEEYNLSKGDSIYFDASQSHIFYNRGRSETRVLSIISPPTI